MRISRCISQHAIRRPDGGYPVGDHKYPLVIRVALNPRAIGCGKTARTRSTQRISIVVFQFPVTLIVIRWSNERRMLTLTMHMVRFPFPLSEGLCPNEVVFLGQTRFQQTRSTVCFTIPPLGYTARCTPAIRPSPPSSFSSRREDIPTARTSGALSPRLREQVNCLSWVRVILSLLPLAD